MRDGKALGDTVFANTIAAYEALPDGDETPPRRVSRRSTAIRCAAGSRTARARS